MSPILIAIALALLLPLALVLLSRPGRRPDDPEVLRALGWERLEGGDPAGARAAFEAHLAARPRSAEGAYALACAEAARGALESSIAWFERAAEWRFPDPDAVSDQPELVGLQDDGRFRAAWERMRAGAEAA